MNSLLKLTIAIAALSAISSAFVLRKERSGEESDNIYLGDILLVNSQQGNSRSRGVLIKNTNKWPGGIIYWKFSNSSSYTTAQRTLITDGMKLVADATRVGTKDCISFQEISNTALYPNHVNILNTAGKCNSYLGMIGGSQVMNLGTTCSKGSTAHEFIHALGFDHEQNRPDRDTYITVNFANIGAGSESNFFKKNDTQVNTLSTSYDLESIMHYSSGSFSSNGLPTIVPKFPTNITMGQRDRLSNIDVQEIRLAYSCLLAGQTAPPTTTGPTTVAPLAPGEVYITDKATGTTMNDVGLDGGAVTMSAQKPLESEKFKMMSVGTSGSDTLYALQGKKTSRFISVNSSDLNKLIMKTIPIVSNTYQLTYSEVFVLSNAAGTNEKYIKSMSSSKYVRLSSSNNFADQTTQNNIYIVQ